MSWPIPDICQLLKRIGDSRPRFFAVTDLTKGFYQTELAEESHAYSAFITFMGTYEWLRVPMGLKGAPSYFQQALAGSVFPGLLYNGLELYIDDVIVYGRTEEEYLARLRQTFERLRLHGVTLNPKKCRFGLSEVEFVGHTISENGLDFSDEKKRKVVDFPKPRSASGVRGFLGLANYFRDHVRMHSLEVQPIQQLLEGLKGKHAEVTWTPEAEAAFERIKRLIGDCPRLSFIQEGSEIHLYTDASDYGVGGYLCQRLLGPSGEVVEELPVAFVSKVFSKQQTRWSTIEKEAYATVFCFKKLEYLLRDVHFVLHTDHKNLTYVNAGSSSKAHRWKILVQDFDYDVEYIKGELNVVADSLSRLLGVPLKEQQVDGTTKTRVVCSMELDDIPPDKYSRMQKVHNSVMGHHGVDRCIRLLKEAKLDTDWPRMRHDVRSFVRKCPCCQKMDRLKVPIRTHTFTTAAHYLAAKKV